VSARLLELQNMLRSGQVFRQRFLLSNNDSISWIDASAPRGRHSEALHTAGSLLTDNRIPLRAMV
jgi:hypothetical protein